MLEPYDFVIHPEAQDDIRIIIEYISIELYAPKAAADLLKELRYKIDSLAFMPHRVKLIDEFTWHDRGMLAIHLRRNS